MRAKWFITFVFVSLVCFGFSGTAIAQDDLESMFDDMDETFREMEKQLEEIDRDFTKFLAREWKQMDMLEGMLKYEVPKPVNLPPAPKETPPAPTTDQKKMIVKPAPIVAPAVAPVTAVRPKPGPGNALDFSFYGQPVSIKYNPKVKSAKAPAINNRGIAAYWAAMGSADPKNLIGQFQHYKSQLGLNDWGYFMLVHMAGEKMYGGDANQANLFSWFVMTKSGYRTRIGITGTRIVLFGTSMTTLYGSPFLTIGGARYYSLSTRGPVKRFGRLYTYQGNYPKTGRPMDLRFTKYPNLKPALVNRNLKFRYRGKGLAVPVSADKNLVEFMKFYPQTDFKVYFAAGTSPYGGASLLKSLEPAVRGKSEIEAVRVLLRFSQKAFQYKTDQNQFGREKVFLPEETLLYPYSDCEDRSILFSFLVGNLTGLKVVGLDYPEHIATAVKFNTPVKGDAINHNGAKYIVCDPTFINADVGMSMPKYKRGPVNVIDFKS